MAVGAAMMPLGRAVQIQAGASVGTAWLPGCRDSVVVVVVLVLVLDDGVVAVLLRCCVLVCVVIVCSLGFVL